MAIKFKDNGNLTVSNLTENPLIGIPIDRIRNGEFDNEDYWVLGDIWFIGSGLLNGEYVEEPTYQLDVFSPSTSYDFVMEFDFNDQGIITIEDELGNILYTVDEGETSISDEITTPSNVGSDFYLVPADSPFIGINTISLKENGNLPKHKFNDDSSIDCFEINEFEILNGNTKHKFYDNGLIKIAGELIEI